MFRWFSFGRFARFGRFACFGRFGGFVSLVSLVSVVSFRPFRFVVSGFSTCPSIFMFTIPVTYMTLQRTYRYLSSTPLESLSPLILTAIISHHILTLDTAHISALQIRPAFNQQQLLTVHALLHVQESSSSTSSGAGLDPSHTNSRHLRCCQLSSRVLRVHQGRGLPEREQWLFSKIAA